MRPATIEVAASLANYVVPVAREKKGHRRKRQREKAEARQRAYPVGEEHHAMTDADGQGGPCEHTATAPDASGAHGASPLVGGVADDDVDDPSSSQSTEAWDALEAEEDELDESSEATAPMYEETYPAPV